MKTVLLFRDFDYRTHQRRTVRFYAGATYTRVIEAAASAIVRAGAGRIVELDKRDGTAGAIDADHCWKVPCQR